MKLGNISITYVLTIYIVNILHLIMQNLVNICLVSSNIRKENKLFTLNWNTE